MKIIRKNQRGKLAAAKAQRLQVLEAKAALSVKFPNVSEGLQSTLELLAKVTETPDIVKKLKSSKILRGSDAVMARAIVKAARLQGLTGDTRKVTHGVKYREKRATKTACYDLVETQAQLAHRIAETLRNRLRKSIATKKGQ